MHTFQIKGIITPVTKPLTIPGQLKTQFALDYFSDTLEITSSINSGSFAADCTTENIGREHFWSVLGYAQDFLSLQMYLMTMSSGTLFGFFPRTVSCDGGADEDIVAENANLSAIFQLLKQNDQGQTDLNAFRQLMGIAGTEPGMIVAIRDFQLALANGGQRITACTRAIEALRNSMFGHDPSDNERGQAWSLFRQNLSLSQGFITSCTSNLHRHGRSKSRPTRRA
jgi:hypothetical protein